MACPSLIASLSVLPLTCSLTHVGVVNNHGGPQGKENKRAGSPCLDEFGVFNDEISIGEYMETLYVWLFVGAGATLIIQGIFLLASERELRKQRREIDMLRRNHRPSEPQGFEKHPSAELMTRNKEL